MAHYARVVQLR